MFYYVFRRWCYISIPQDLVILSRHDDKSQLWPPNPCPVRYELPSLSRRTARKALSSGILNDRWHAISKYGLSLNARADYRIKCESTARARAFMYNASPLGGVIGMRGRDDSVYWDAVCKRRLPAFSWLTHRPPPLLPPFLNRDSPRIWSTMKIAFTGKTDYLKIIDFRPTPSPLLRALVRQARWREEGIRRRISNSSFGPGPHTGIILFFPSVVNVELETMKGEEGDGSLSFSVGKWCALLDANRDFPDLLFSQKQSTSDWLSR